MFSFIKSLLIVLFAVFAYSQSSKIENLTTSQVKILNNNKSQIPIDFENLKNQLIEDSNPTDNFSNEEILNDVLENLPNDKAINSDDNEKVTESSELNFDDELEKIDDTEKKSIQNLNFMTSSGKYFGYDIFQSDPGYFEKSSSEALDPDYIIGSGDEIIIMLWGQTEFQDNYIVSKEGYIFVENLGQVFVNGLNLEKLEKKLFKLLSKVYSSLMGGSGQGSSFLDVSLGSLTLRSIRVFVLGEVSQPGAYLIKPNSTLFTSLYYFNGPTTNGSLRDIALIRSNKEIAKIDFYDFLLFGKQDNDMRLQKDDVIFIPKRGKSVSINGEINSPYIYELKIDEEIEDLIRMAGGIMPTTYMNHAQIKRIIPADERNESGIDRTIIDINLSDVINKKMNIDLIDQDEISFYKISDIISNTITIQGAVKRPGVYDFGNGLRVLDLINKADGILGTTYLKKADITRIKTDNTKDYFEINLSKALEGDFEHNKQLGPNDVLIVYDFYNMKYRTDVSIGGHVENPGQYEFQNGMTVADLVFLGGGFENELHLINTYTEKALFTRKIESSVKDELIFFRLDSVLSGRGIADEKLKMGDAVTIYNKEDIQSKLPTFVNVEGFVKRPGEYNLFQDMKIIDLLDLAGGLNDSNYVDNIYFQRADLFRTDFSNMEIEIMRLNLGDEIAQNFNLSNGDILRVYSRDFYNEEKKVKIEGIINVPGEYNYKNDMSFLDLILDAGGIDPKYKNYKVEINRKFKGKQSKNSKSITFWLKNDLSILEQDRIGAVNNNMLIQPQDLIIVRPELISSDFDRLTIRGFVKYPGDYIILSPLETIGDIIKRAGGVLEGANLKNSFFTRNGNRINIAIEKIVKNPKNRSSFAVTNGDEIFIGGKSQVVEVRGEVNVPGFYQFFKGYRYNDYVKLAGGYTRNASKFSSYVEIPDGKSTKIKIWKYSPKVYDGSIINVGAKEEFTPFNFTEYITNLTAIYADVSQAYLMIILATRQ